MQLASHEIWHPMLKFQELFYVRGIYYENLQLFLQWCQLATQKFHVIEWITSDVAIF